MVLLEMPLRNTQAIIDLAVIDDRLHAYEIKSDLDNLSRQAAYYDRTFDEVTLVTTRLTHSNFNPSHWRLAVTPRLDSLARNQLGP